MRRKETKFDWHRNDCDLKKKSKKNRLTIYDSLSNQTNVVEFIDKLLKFNFFNYKTQNTKRLLNVLKPTHVQGNEKYISPK